jgi:integrase/recombinase XerD
MTTPAQCYELDRAEVERVWACHIAECAGERWYLRRGNRAMLQQFLDAVHSPGPSDRPRLRFDQAAVLQWMTRYAQAKAVAYVAQRLAVFCRFLQVLRYAGLVDTDLLAEYRNRQGQRSWLPLVQALQSPDPGLALAALRRCDPSGPLAAYLQPYLELQQALGKKFAAHAQVLRELDRFLLAQAVPRLAAITPTLIEQWLQQRTCILAVRLRKAGYARRFFDYLIGLQLVTDNPVPARWLGTYRERCTSFKPFLFTSQQLASILTAAERLPDRHPFCSQTQTCFAMLVLLSALGLRHGEACRLRLQDLDLDRQTLFIHQTKFHKSRYVPFGPKVGQCLQQFLEVRRLRLLPLREEDPLFVTCWRKPVSQILLRRSFRRLLREVGVATIPGQRPPRLHDLRHTFAVQRLLRWYRTGVDVQSRLPALATFLGHIRPQSTEVYLTITAELLHEANSRFHRHFGQPEDAERPS